MPSNDLYEFFLRNPQSRPALEQLKEARRGAQLLRLDVWAVAIELSVLLSAGCTVTDLRLLVAAGCLEHAEEVTQSPARARRFRPESHLVFGPRTCFVLTDSAAEWVARQEKESDPGMVKLNGQSGRRVPRWSAVARELQVDGRVIKRLRRPAPNLELVLAAFEEEAWSPHLDDPLPPEHDIDSHQRLRDTVRRLNNCQTPHRIRFESDGLGAGIRWRWA
jgi:hypothetical protein